MAESGTSQSGSAPDAALESTTGGDSADFERGVGFSLWGLLGALVVSSVMTLVFVNVIMHQGQNLKAGGGAQGVAAFAELAMLWLAIVFSCVASLCYCFVGLLASSVFNKGELWFFSLAGLLSSVVVCVFTSELLGPVSSLIFPLIHGAATTSTYWLISKWPAA